LTTTAQILSKLAHKHATIRAVVLLWTAEYGCGCEFHGDGLGEFVHVLITQVTFQILSKCRSSVREECHWLIEETRNEWRSEKIMIVEREYKSTKQQNLSKNKKED
jgi:hypothetical protein